MSKDKFWYKTGPLSQANKEYIIEYINRIPIDEIAARLKRRVETIENFCRKSGLKFIKAAPSIYDMGADPPEIQEMKQILRSKNYYTEIRAQLLDDLEVQYFEDRWVEIHQQFRGDLLATEEIQMRQMIMFDILMNRLNKQRRKQIDFIAQIEKKLRELYLQDVLDGDKIAATEEQLASYRNTLGSYDVHHQQLQQKFNDLMKELKGTREQRIKIIEDSKKDWGGLLKYFEEEDVRLKEGKHMTVMKELVDITRKEFYEYHEYADKSICPPIMTPESVRYNKELDAQAQKSKEKSLQE